MNAIERHVGNRCLRSRCLLGAPRNSGQPTLSFSGSWVIVPVAAGAAHRKAVRSGAAFLKSHASSAGARLPSMPAARPTPRVRRSQTQPGADTRSAVPPLSPKPPAVDESSRTINRRLPRHTLTPRPATRQGRPPLEPTPPASARLSLPGLAASTAAVAPAPEATGPEKLAKQRAASVWSAMPGAANGKGVSGSVSATTPSSSSTACPPCTEESSDALAVNVSPSLATTPEEPTAKELVFNSRLQLEELRSMRNPPALVRKALQTAYMLLSCERVESLGGPDTTAADSDEKSWKRCLRMLADENFVSQLLGFETIRLNSTPKVAEHLRQLLVADAAMEEAAKADTVQNKDASSMGTSRWKKMRSYDDYLHAHLVPAAVARAHAPCGFLVMWMKALLEEWVGSRAGRPGPSPQQDMAVEPVSPLADDASLDTPPFPALQSPQGSRPPAEEVLYEAPKGKALPSPQYLASRRKSSFSAALDQGGVATLPRALPADGKAAGKGSFTPLPVLLRRQQAEQPADQVVLPIRPALAVSSAARNEGRCTADGATAGEACKSQQDGTGDPEVPSVLQVAPPQEPLKTRWTDGFDIRPQAATLGRGAWQAVHRKCTKSECVELTADAPSEVDQRALSQLRVPFGANSDEVTSAENPEQTAALKRLSEIVQPKGTHATWHPKVCLEGRRQSGEAKGIEVARVIAVFKWLVDRGVAEPGVLRLGAHIKPKAGGSVLATPIRELCVLRGPLQTELSVDLPPGLFFDASSSILTAASLAVVKEMALWLQAEEHEEITITIEGHADRLEKDVSLSRAKAVHDAIAFHGVSPDRMCTQASSSWHPVSRSAMAMNRRVEVHVH